MVQFEVTTARLASQLSACHRQLRRAVTSFVWGNRRFPDRCQTTHDVTNLLSEVSVIPFQGTCRYNTRFISVRPRS
jgi:hypothetical protein